MTRTIMFAGIVAAAVGFVDDAGGARSTLLPADAFGFVAGEERRYVLGPPENLLEGESATWTILFEGWVDNGRAAGFKLRHDRQSPQARQPGDIERLGLEATLMLRPHGFPIDLVFTVRESVYGLGDDIYSVRYSYEKGAYFKEVWTYNKDWSIRTPIPNHRNLDTSALDGLFLFLPAALHCMGSLDRTRLSAARREACTDSDPAFANPGLLSVAIHRLQASGAEDFDALFFTPLGPDVYPGLRPGVSVSAARGRSPTAASVGIGGRWMDGDIDRLLDLRRYFEPVRLRLGDAVRVRVGARTMDAARLDVSGTLRDVYIDDEGKVLRADLDPHPATRKSRWIRLLFASEY